jgi:predicted exporter
VTLNRLTTIAGFAALMVAHHRGIFGLGLLLTIGMIASLVASLVVLPVLLRCFAGPAPPEALAVRADVAPGAALSSEPMRGAGRMLTMPRARTRPSFRASPRGQPRR